MAKEMQVLRREIAKLKAKGAKSVDVVDIYKATHLPVTRITHLMHKLEREGLVASDD
jgi:DNA-binding IclR family transcriptional regulator